MLFKMKDAAPKRRHDISRVVDIPQTKRLMNKKEIIAFYKDLDQLRLRAALSMILSFDVYVLSRNGRYFTGNTRGQGVQIFTDWQRAVDFCNSEGYGVMGIKITRVQMSKVYAVNNCDIYINFPPAGDDTLYFSYDCSQNAWSASTTNRQRRYTLPYGLEPFYLKEERSNVGANIY